MLERRIHGDIAVLVSKRLESDGFLFAFTERTGGVSTGPFASLNLGLRTGEEPAAALANRRQLCEVLGIPSFACVRQVHGARIARVGPKRAGAGFEDPADAVADADAMITSSRGIAMAVLTADCVPIAIADPATGRFAVVHAGWRGIAAGMLTAAVAAVRGANLHAAVRGGELHSAVGPAVGVDHYEVGEDVAFAVSAASPDGAVTKKTGGRLLLDLPGTAVRILKAAGVSKIDRAEECTACLPERFYSYRRDGETGRQALVGMRLGG
jgi:YfiH family protein